MSRDVCGVCWCPYGDDGRCGCKSTPMVKDDTTLLLECVGLLMQMPVKHPQQAEYREDLIKRIEERLK